MEGVNPLLSVPTLELDTGDHLTESVAIIEWLETYPEPPLLPAGVRARARVRELVQLINAGVHPLQNTSVRLAVASDRNAQDEWAARWIKRGLRAYEQHIGNEPGPCFSTT